MLDKHLIAVTKPQAEKENIVLWGKYRITVLSDRLFRLEQSENNTFCDDATQSVWFRNMPAQVFDIEEDIFSLKIKTSSCTLIVMENREDCRIVLDDSCIKIDNSQNLFGTARTLDGYSGNKFVGFYKVSDGKAEEDQLLELGYGVCSRNGVAVLDDSDSLIINSLGELEPKKTNSKDEYIFAYGDNYKEAVKALYMICGKTPLIPRFALGNWWSRYHAYTDKEYLKLLNLFEEHDIPLSVAAIDMDWHYSKNIDEEMHITELGKNTDFYGGNNGWTGYSFNKKLFPDYRSFIKKVKDKNLKVTLNLHPKDGIRWWEDCYNEMAKAMNIDEKSEEQIKFDMTDSKFVNSYFSVVHKPYENDGVSFWWIDWQQGKESKIKGLDPLWLLNHYHYLDNGLNSDTPLILSRYSGVGSHRYPLGFSGDTYITWETLDYLPYFTATASNIGYTWWSHDIGGHMYGEKDDELYLRSVQFGVFSPINRLHCTNATVCSKEPWYYGNGTGVLAEKWLRFRHKLIPYLYTSSYLTNNDGIALVEPLYYRWKTSQAYQYKNEYFFGPQLLVAPITSKINSDGFARTNIWLQNGKWIDIFTNAEYEADEKGKEFKILRKLDTIPVFIKSGGILPLSSNVGNKVSNPKILEVWAWSGDGSFTMYEDGLENNKTENLITEFKSHYSEENGIATQELCIKSHGNKDIVPDNRLFKVRFKDIQDGTVKLWVDDDETFIDETLTNCSAVDLNIECEKEYRVKVIFKPKTRLEKIKEYAKTTLICAEDNLKNRNDLLKQIMLVNSLKDYKSLIHETDKVNETVKDCLLEIL